MKIGIVGIGNFGRSLAYTIALKNLSKELALIDIDKNKAKATCFDLQQGWALTNLTKVVTGGYEILADANIIIITAGKPREYGQKRFDLISENIQIVSDILKNILEYNNDFLLLITTNPVDIITYVAYKVSGLPKENIIGIGTILDTIRLKSLIVDELNINPQDIGLYILGEHGENMVPIFSKATIHGEPLNNLSNFDAKKINALVQRVKLGGEDILKLKQPPVFAPSLAAAYVLESIINDSKRIIPISSYIQGEYGLDEVCLSLPFRIGQNGLEEVVNLKINDDELKNLRISQGILRSELDSIKNLI